MNRPGSVFNSSLETENWIQFESNQPVFGIAPFFRPAISPKSQTGNLAVPASTPIKLEQGEFDVNRPFPLALVPIGVLFALAILLTITPLAQLVQQTPALLDSSSTNGDPKIQPIGAVVRTNESATLRVSYETTADNRCRFEGDLEVRGTGKTISHRQETPGECRPEDLVQGVERLIERINKELQASPGLLRKIWPLIDAVKSALGVY